MDGRRWGVFGVVTISALLLAGPAGAAPGVGQVTVSNPAPTQASEIEVSSTGWRPGGVVSITLWGTDGVLGRATADATGAVHAQISIPTSAREGFRVLSVNGSTPAGVPQEIVTSLSIVRAVRAPAPARPWVAVFLLVALATLFLLASQKVVHRDGLAPIG